MKNRFSNIKIIMGLGNPEAAYKNTYHNAGKLMIDYLLGNLGGSFRKKASGDFESCVAGGLTLVKPTNYMNESGKAVKAALKSFGAKVDSLLIAHDDGDIEIGKYKISFGSGSAGHRGAQSVIESLGTKNFWRLRIGIRGTNPPSLKLRRARAEEFVLKKITDTDGKLMCSAFEKAREEISSALGKAAI